MREIYVSSLAFIGSTPEKMVAEASANGFALEFSSGIPFRDDMEAFYLAAPSPKMLHNYFPAPAVPFVLNLASGNEAIRQQSIMHCRNGLSLASKSGSRFFSAHAGFCIDPSPEELGRKINFSNGFDPELHFNLFIDSLNQLLASADELNTDFLIENNVIAAFNLTQQGNNPLFCCEAKNIHRVFERLDHPKLGLLLDTAHLKVSCNTLGLRLEDEFNSIRQYIRGIHHSDNDAATDNNLPLDKDYWFLPYIKDFSSSVHVIEVKSIGTEKIKEQINLIESYGR